jgi:hypothetical protein
MLWRISVREAEKGAAGYRLSDFRAPMLSALVWVITLFQSQAIKSTTAIDDGRAIARILARTLLGND